MAWSHFVLLIITLVTFIESREQSQSINWWNGGVTSSVVRVRESWSYDKQSKPILDMWWVIIKEAKIHVYNPDELSMIAIRKANNFIYGESLRASGEIPNMMNIQVHNDPEEIFSFPDCDHRFALNSLYFLKPWFHENMYHLVNDATMVLFHKSTTPPVPSSLSTSSQSKFPNHTRAMFRTESKDARYLSQQVKQLQYDAKLLKFPTKHGALSWVHQVFFHSSAFPAGTDTPALSVINSQKPLCVGGFHWGSPLRVISAPLVPQQERKAAVRAVNEQLRNACPRVSLNKSNSNNLHVVFVARKEGNLKRSRNRVIADSTVELLRSAFNNVSIGGPTTFEVCCDFKMRTPCDLGQTFYNADVVIGMHGAGLANSVFSTKPTGSILIELRTSYGGHYDIFSTLTVGTGAGYMWVAMGSGPNGTVLPIDQINQIAQCSVDMIKMRRSDVSYNGSICQPVRSKGGPSSQHPGLFGYTPIDYAGDECYRKRLKPPCYPGLRTFDGTDSFYQNSNKKNDNKIDGTKINNDKMNKKRRKNEDHDDNFVGKNRGGRRRKNRKKPLNT